MSLTKTALGGILTAGMMGVGLAATAAPATAAHVGVTPAVYTCQDNQICFYQHIGLHGSVLISSNGSSYTDLTRVTFANGTNANDEISSVRNNTNQKAQLFVDINFSGASFTCLPHTSCDLTDFNDTASSIKVF